MKKTRIVNFAGHEWIERPLGREYEPQEITPSALAAWRESLLKAYKIRMKGENEKER